MEELHYYSIQEAANILKVSPERIQEMLSDGELKSIPPEESGGREWKIPLRVRPSQDRSAQMEPRTTPALDAESSSEQRDKASAQREDQPAERPAPTAAPRGDTTATVHEARGSDAATVHEPTASSGWVSTQQAARALGISPRTVRWHIEQGNLDAKPEGEGVKRTWLVSIDSLQAFRDARQTTGGSPGHYRSASGSADITAESPGSAIRELADRLVEEAARASEFRVRLELSERAQSTLEAELATERRRREEAERERAEARQERDELRRRLADVEKRPLREYPSEPREAPDTATEQPGRVGSQTPLEGAQEPAQGRPWWRRIFGG
jgi:excisionase family DNA binding protein